MTSRCRSISIGVLLAVSSAQADDAAQPPIRAFLADPAQLADWLRTHDPQIEAAQAKIEAAVAAGQQARVFPNPQLSLGLNNVALGNGNPNSGGLTAFDQTTNYSIGVGELVEIGKRGPRRAAADLRTQEAGETRVATLGGQVSNATATLGKLAYVVARHDLIATNLTTARTVLDKEHDRLVGKDMSPLDFKRLQLDTHDVEIQLQRADADVAAALATCSATLFASCTPDGLDAGTLDIAAPLPPALPESESAVGDRPTHRAERLEEHALGQDALLADHRKIPDPTVGVAYIHDNFEAAGDLTNTFGLSVSIPLPFFDRGNHDAAAARANAHAVEATDRAEIRQERGQVDAYAKTVTALQAALTRLEKESVPQSQEILEKTRAAFDLGEVRIVDLLLAERAHRDLLLEVLDTRFDLFNARAQLRQALGLDDVAARGAVK